MKKIILSFSVLSCWLFSACSKTVESGTNNINALVLNYPVNGSYNNAVSGLTYFNRALFELGSGETDTLLMEALIQNPLDKDITVNVNVDEAALTAYNNDTAHKNKYVIFPTANYKIVTPTVIIPAGKTVARLKVAVKPQLFETHRNGYMLPVSISSGTPGIEVAQALKTVYLHLEKGKPAYCTAAGGNAGQVLTLSTTGAAHNINYAGSTYPTNGYGLYTADSIKVIPSSSFTLNMTTSSEWCRVSVYADWNNNGSFTNLGEAVLSVGLANQGNSATVLNISKNIAVPATLEPGQSRIRVRIYDAWIADPGPCGSFNYTTTQDFLVHLGN